MKVLIQAATEQQVKWLTRIAGEAKRFQMSVEYVPEEGDVVVKVEGLITGTASGV